LTTAPDETRGRKANEIIMWKNEKEKKPFFFCCFFRRFPKAKDVVKRNKIKYIAPNYFICVEILFNGVPMKRVGILNNPSPFYWLEKAKMVAL
jgi:hypothetical protein